MSIYKAFPLFAVVGLSACQVPTLEPAPTVPEAVVALAAPNQDLSTARLNEVDNCYWYDHRGIVETTPLPLRTAKGNQICVKTEAAPAS